MDATILLLQAEIRGNTSSKVLYSRPTLWKGSRRIDLSTADEQDQVIMQNWNSVVTDEDEFIY